MVAAFPPKYAVIIVELNLQELIRVLRHCIKCAQSHSTKYDTLNCLYLVVTEELYNQYAPLVFDENGNPVLDEGPTYNMMNVENNTAMHNIWEQKNMFYTEDKHTHRAL